MGNVGTVIVGVGDASMGTTMVPAGCGHSFCDVRSAGAHAYGSVGDSVVVVSGEESATVLDSTVHSFVVPK